MTANGAKFDGRLDCFFVACLDSYLFTAHTYQMLTQDVRQRQAFVNTVHESHLTRGLAGLEIRNGEDIVVASISRLMAFAFSRRAVRKVRALCVLLLANASALTIFK